MRRIGFFRIILGFAIAGVDADSSWPDTDPPELESLNEGEKEAAKTLWASFTELKDVHAKFQSAFDLSQTMFDEVIGNSQDTSRFMQAKHHSQNPVDQDKIRKGDYATQMPRTPPQMNVRIFDGIDEAAVDKEITEEAQEVLAARIRDNVDDEIQQMAQERQDAVSDSRVAVAADAVLTSLAAAAAREPPTQEEEERTINHITASKANPGAHEPPAEPIHSTGRLPCGSQPAFRQTNNGPIDFSSHSFQETEQQGEFSKQETHTETEAADSESLTVVSPFKPTVPAALRIHPPPPKKETGVPNGYYGRSRSFF